MYRASRSPEIATVTTVHDSEDIMMARALDLVFFSAFEDLRLITSESGTMESNGIRKLYEASPVPTLSRYAVTVLAGYSVVDSEDLLKPGGFHHLEGCAT